MPQKRQFVQQRKRPADPAQRAKRASDEMALSCSRLRFSEIRTMFPNCDYHTHPQAHSVRPYTLELLRPWIDQCRARHIQSIAFTDHDRYINGVDFDVIERLRDKNPDIEILAGIELDNDPVSSADGLRWVEKNWDRLDFVLGSVHYFNGETEMLDRTGEPGQIEARGPSEAFEQYKSELGKLISRGFIDCLAHLDLVKIHGLFPDRYDPVAQFRSILELAHKAGLAMEASTAGWRKAVDEAYPHPAILRTAVELGIPITTASDAHSYAQVGADFDKLALVLKTANVTEIVSFSHHKINRAIRPT